MRTALFTIISPNYRHHARVLMESALQHQPDWDRFVLLVGATAFDAPQAEDSFETLELSALRLPHERQFCFRYRILELDTAVKPWVFTHLFARGYDRVVYLDPDTVLYSPLQELDEVRDPLLVVTPHLTRSASGDVHPSERSILQAGTYNLGFLAAWRHPDLDRFLGWWREKLEFQCLAEPERGLFVDQKWIDLTPGLFSGVHVLRHEGYNVAYWNLRQRAITRNARGTLVNGVPLRLFHFSGFDLDAPQQVSKYDLELETTDLGDGSVLFQEYARAVQSAGIAAFRKAPYAFGTFHDGTPIRDLHRITYRNSVALQESAGSDPFAHPELFRRMRESGRGELTRRVGRASYEILSSARPLVRLLPSPVRVRLREFLLGHHEPRGPRRKATLPQGINVVGYDHATGVGESARLFRRSCDAASIPTQFLDAENDEAAAARYGTSVYHVNADMTAGVHQTLHHLFEASAYNIGVWHWELPELPDMWIDAAAPLDEIWAPSAFIQSAVSRKVTIPVVHMPHGVEVACVEACSPEELGVPGGRFTFLCMFDLASFVERKNPFGAVEAFRRAFRESDEVALLLKTSSADAELRARLENLPNVYLVDRVLPRTRVNGLIAACDAVVSLHRSEGFGLVPAEAMFLGKPVIATGWSGNMDFMNAANSLPVDYELVTLERTYGNYHAGQQWAEPDLDHAAHCMRQVFEDAQLRARIGARAAATMRTRFSPKAAGRRYRERLRFLGLMNG